MYESKVKFGTSDLSLWDFGSIEEMSISQFIDNSQIQFMEKDKVGGKAASKKVQRVIDVLSECEVQIHEGVFAKVGKK